MGAGQDFTLGAALWVDSGSQVFSGGSRQFTASNSEYFTLADNASLSMGDIDFTIACWVYLDTTPANEMRTINKFDISGTDREYSLFWDNTGGLMTFTVRDTGDTTSSPITASTEGSLSTGQWYCVIAEHDSVNNTISIQINNKDIDSTAHTTGVRDGTADFRIGSLSEGGEYWDGRIANVGCWKRILTTDERSFLYGAGLGKAYSQLDSIGKGVGLTTSLISYWDLNEVSGDAIDKHGSNNLTDTATVTNNTGVTNLARSDFTAGFLKNTGELSSLSFYKNNFSISAWIKLVNNGDSIYIFNIANIIGSTHKVELSVDLNGSIVLFLEHPGTIDTITTVSTPVNTNWGHITIAVDRTNNTVDFYFNGIFLEQQAITITDELLTDVWRIGENIAETSSDEGIIGPVGIWTQKKILSAEAMSLYNGGDPVLFKCLPLPLNNPSEYWNMNEVSGDAISAREQVITKSREPNKAGLDSFTSLTAGINPGSGSFTIAGWASTTAGVFEYIIQYADLINAVAFGISHHEDTDNKLKFNLTNSGGTTVSVKEDLVSTGLRYIICDYDSVNNIMSIKVDENIKTGDTGMVIGDEILAQVYIGKSEVGNILTGTVCQWGYWKRLLTDDERTYLYNKGRGRIYTDLGTADTGGADLLTSLFSYWALDEASGSALDSHGSNTLAQSGVVPSGSGLPSGDLLEQTTVGSSIGPGLSHGLAIDGESISAIRDKITRRFFEQDTKSKQPTYTLNAINSKPAMTFDGSSQLLVLDETGLASILNGSQGHVFAAVQISTLQDNLGVLTSGDESAGNDVVDLRAYRDATFNGITFRIDDNVNDNVLSGSTTDVIAATTYILHWSSTGTAYAARVNGIVQSFDLISGVDNGNWFGDVANRDSIAIGAFKRTSEGNYFKGDIAEIIAYDGVSLTATEISQIESSLALKYGVSLP